MRLWQSKPIWLNSDSFLPNNNVNPSISYYIYKVAFLSTKPSCGGLLVVATKRKGKNAFPFLLLLIAAPCCSIRIVQRMTGAVAKYCH